VSVEYPDLSDYLADDFTVSPGSNE